MQLSRPTLLLVLAASGSTTAVHVQPSIRATRSSPTLVAADLTHEQSLIEESEAALRASDYATARAKAAEAVTLLLARPEVAQDAAWLVLLDSAGLAAAHAQDAHTAHAAWERGLEVRSRTLPDDHPDLQRARGNLAATIAALGDLAGARALEEQVLEVLSRTLPDDHPDLQAARTNLAATIRELGDLAGARGLQEQVLATLSRTLPAEHPHLQAARQNLSLTLAQLGDLPGARALQEQVLEVYSRTLSAEHPDLQRARGNLAVTIAELGDLAGARTLQEQVLDGFSRTLPAEHPDLQTARAILAATIHRLGNLAGARALQEQVLEVFSRTLPPEHPALQEARANLAATEYMLGDLVGARALQERVLEVFSRTLPPEHPHLLAAQVNLAATVCDLGDLAGARALQEQVLEMYSRTLPEEHPDLQAARNNLAVTFDRLGDFAGARTLQEQVLEVFSRTLPPDHLGLQHARLNLAATIEELGDLAGARALEERVLEVFSRTLPTDHLEVQVARGNLATAIHEQGDLAGARTLQEQVLEVFSRTLPAEHPDLQVARANLALMVASQHARSEHAQGGEGARTPERESRERCAELIGAVCRAQASAAREAIVGSPGREAEERCSSLAKRLDLCLSFALGLGVFEPLRELEREAFVFAESTRGAAVVAAELTRRASDSPRCTDLRTSLKDASDELADLAQKGTTSEEFERVRARRESVERELVALARELSGGGPSGAELDALVLAARLDEREAAVGFRRFEGSRIEVTEELDSTGQPAVRETPVSSLCAFVVRSTKADAPRDAASALTLVDLGPMEPIEAAVRAWREAVGTGLDASLETLAPRSERVEACGEDLRKLVFDPLLPALGAADRIAAALDDVLHLVPLDALPVADSEELVGDRWRIETRATLTELLSDPPESTEHSGSALVAFGGASFDLPPIALAAEEVASIEERPVRIASILRGTPWERGFAPLTHTSDEARGIVAMYTEIYEGTRPALVVEQRKASRDALEELAPDARFLHIATHGWVAPESVKSWSDPEPRDRHSPLGMYTGIEERIQGMSPMLLCGLALAGANLPMNALGRIPGLLTAEELGALDLSNCELAVLSACDTNVGQRRAGQGVASLQKALHMAGARSVITSLWKVSDAATRLLMEEFYRRMWAGGMSKSRALWEAKQWLASLPAPEVRERLGITSDVQWSTFVQSLRGVGSTVPLDRPAAAASVPPFAHPFYWAGWTLTGEP